MIPKVVASHGLFLLRSNPSIPDRWGYHIRPIHYYEPLPDFRTITPVQIAKRRESIAVKFDWSAQLQLLAELAANYHDELTELAALPESVGFPFNNDYFSGLDAGIYYALIRHLKPERIIEIGSGFSTRIAAKALASNGRSGQPGKLICIEPYPQSRLLDANLEIELITTPVEQVGLKLFEELKLNDILFIDSSHAVKFGSDVCYEFLDILPQLHPGVWVHVHDIFFPYDYPVEWLIEKRIAYNEQYLLEAFLAFNNSYKVMLANYGLAIDSPAEVQALWSQPLAQGTATLAGASSFWFRRL